jgi:hypothetical protein
MPAKDDARSLRITSSFKNLSSRAIEINAATKQLSATIATLDEALRRLNLGISSWVQFGGGESEDGNSEDAYELGYAKINGKWGIAIRYRSWSTMDPDRGMTNEWLFADASRELRIWAIDSIPDLVEKLNKDAEAITAKLKRKIDEAESLANVLNSIDGIEVAL